MKFLSSPRVYGNLRSTSSAAKDSYMSEGKENTFLGGT